jgi:predicted nuclease of predicted toxin-antitoxin system
VSVALYMDVHVPAAITDALRLRGVDVLTAREDSADRLADSALLDRSGAQARVLFSQDADLLREASARQRSDVAFSGLIYAHQLNATIGQCVEDLELIAKAFDPADLSGQVVYIPIR